VLAASFALALTACEGRAPTSAQPTPSAVAAAPAPTPSTAQPAASVLAAPATTETPPRAAGPCAFDRGLVGKVGDARAFAWLARMGRELQGHYFYEKAGRDLALKGTVDDGSFSLAESLDGAATGAFAGTCSRAREIVGTWSSPDGKRSLPFSFAVPDRLTVATRRLKFTTRTRVKDDGAGDCEFTRETPVVLGASSKEVEDRMTAAIADANKELLDPTWEKQARACGRDENGMRLTYFSSAFSVERQDETMLVLEVSGALNSTPSAHPANAVGANVLNLDVATGRTIALAEVVKDEGRLLKLAGSCSADDRGRDLENASPAYLLLRHGIRVVGTSYAHALAVMTFQGPEISYAALLRDGLLKPDSPIAREWANEKPAAPGASPCRVRWNE
jgi:hypothetical protein